MSTAYSTTAYTNQSAAGTAVPSVVLPPQVTSAQYTIPGKKEWEIILSSNIDVLGAFQYDPAYDVARIKVKASNAEELESFSIFFREKKDTKQMVLGWDTTRVNIPISVKESKEYARI